MKLVLFICTILALSVDFGLGQYDYAYGDYAYDDYAVAPPPPRSRLAGRRAGAFRGYRQLFSPFARPAAGSYGFLSQFTTLPPTWTPYPGT